MGTTPNYAWPYPELTDPPDGASQIKALAVASDATTKTLDTRLAAAEQPALGRFTKTSAQSVNNATYTTITFPTKDEDPGVMADAGGTQFTIKKAGIWIIIASMAWAPHATGFRIFTISVNGNLMTGTGAASGGAYNMPLGASAILRLAVNDVVEFTGYQTSGAALNTSATTPGKASFLWQRA